MRPVPSPRTSENFHTLKAASILVVAAGHFVEPTYPLVWFPVALTMLAFAYSSAYFTYVSYGNHVAVAPYWRRKLLRLGPNLFVIDLFLIALALLRGKEGIITWQAGVSLAGLGGILNWFHMPNPSPFGAGTWFFTLLLVFYLSYPWLVRAYGRRAIAAGFMLVSCGTLYWLNQRVVYGHSLWLTIFGFLLGVSLAKYPLRPPAIVSLSGLACVLVLTAAANRAGLKSLNFFFLIGIFVAFVLFWQDTTLPGWVHRALAPLRGCLLEIYLIHTALFFRPTGLLAVDLVISLVGITAAAQGLAFLSGRVRGVLPAPQGGGSGG